MLCSGGGGANDDRGPSLSAFRASPIDDTRRHNRIEFSSDWLASSSLAHHLSFATSTDWHSRLASCSDVMVGAWGGRSIQSFDASFSSLFGLLLSVSLPALLGGVFFVPID